jgi:SAM-dependent methyltransferase
MAEFDREAPVYDATRPPPSREELRAVLTALEGCPQVLEGGVGTGRFSIPLTEAGHHMTGVDLSREMIRRAREKGLHQLVLGSLEHLPFRDQTFDASLLVHVLQLLPDPLPALMELTRVSRHRVVTVFPDRNGAGGQGIGRLRERYREIALELGHPLPPRPRYWQNGKALVARFPPAGIETVAVPRDPRHRETDLLRLQALRSPTIPPEVHERIVERLAEERRARPAPSPAVRHVQVVWWDPATLPLPPSPA